MADDAYSFAFINLEADVVYNPAVLHIFKRNIFELKLTFKLFGNYGIFLLLNVGNGIQYFEKSVRSIHTFRELIRKSVKEIERCICH